MVCVVVDEISRSLDAIEPAADYGRQLALRRCQFLAKVLAHLSDILARIDAAGIEGKGITIIITRVRRLTLPRSSVKRLQDTYL